LHLRCATLAGKLTEQVLPNPTSCPAYKAVVDRGRRAIFGRAIAPAAATFQHVDDATDDATIIGTLDTTDICRQMRLDPPPLFVA
jgi:hypothetical protein